jgi:hypothetical protein
MEAIADPTHERPADPLKWNGHDFVRSRFDTEEPMAPQPSSRRARAPAAGASSRAGRNVLLDLIPGLHRMRILIRRLDRGRLPPSRCETLTMRPQFRQWSSIERFLSARQSCTRLCLRLGRQPMR